MQRSNSLKQCVSKLQDWKEKGSSRSLRKTDNDDQQQKTISEHFASSKHAANLKEVGEPPYSKRRKRTQSATDPSFTTSTSPFRNMYDFGNGTEVGDSPRKGSISHTAKPAFMSKRIGNSQTASYTTPTGAKQLVVKNLRRTPQPNPEHYFNQVWFKVDAALSALFVNEKVPSSLEELYRGVETLCRQDKAPALWQKLERKCGSHTTSRVKESVLAECGVGDDTDALRAAVKAWSIWSAQMATVRSIFFYLDRSYLLHSPVLPSIEDLGIGKFRLDVFSEARLRSRVLQGACDLVTYDRTGNLRKVDNVLLQQAIKMFHTLGVYDKEFEPKFLGASQRFLFEWAEQEIPKGNLAGYVQESQALFERETDRCVLQGLTDSTKNRLIMQMEEILILCRENYLVDSAKVSDLLERDEIQILQQLFSLLQLKGLGEKLRPAFEAYIDAVGSSIVFDEDRESEMVIRLLGFKKKLDIIWKTAFHRHEGLGHSLREAFEEFINKIKKTNMTWGTDNPKPGEMIAKYVDMILRGGSKAIPATLPSAPTAINIRDDEDLEEIEGDEDAEINRQLDQVLDMFRFVHGKAVFEAFYKKDLARRLLLNRSASNDAEKSMLTRLKSECGAGFTHNLEQMFKDIELAREEISSYKAMLNDRQQYAPVDLNVNVLSASAWPTYPDLAIEIPSDISKSIASFEEHYKTKHTGRKLAWKHALAHCQLKASFPKGNKEIVVSSFQAVVMLQFNGRPQNEPMSFDELSVATNLNSAELKRTLQSLACAKYRVLSKSPKGKDVAETDSFTVNLNFSDPKYRIKINQIQLKETREENKETHQRVAADRHYECQAAIVRIMKSRKTITHPLLMAEVHRATMSRGQLEPQDVKKNIDKLIEKDYMEREEGGKYRYLA